MKVTGNRLVKASGKDADELEKSIVNALNELAGTEELKGRLNQLYFVGAQELQFNDKKAIVIYVPVAQLPDYHKIHARLVRELEKKFGGKHVVFIGRRRIMPEPKKGKKGPITKGRRPYSRTLTAVHEAILDDLVYPAEIVGKRIRYKLDGKQLIKAHLDKAQQTNVEHKVDTFSSLYKYLTGKAVTFEFPEPLF
uniref:40S ribosomal protein S7 n=1 Tax=Panagrolaimus sp. JU765 TaxID=591449 RepID=A0AC34RDR5_9BILA